MAAITIGASRRRPKAVSARQRQNRLAEIHSVRAEGGGQAMELKLPNGTSYQTGDRKCAWHAMALAASTLEQSPFVAGIATEPANASNATLLVSPCL